METNPGPPIAEGKTGKSTPKSRREGAIPLEQKRALDKKKSSIKRKTTSRKKSVPTSGSIGDKHLVVRKEVRSLRLEDLALR